MSLTYFPLIVVMWVLYFGMLVRALANSRDENPFRARIWLMFFYGCVTFTLSGNVIEAQVDRYFHGLPVSVYIKFFCQTQIAHIYYLITRAVNPEPSRVFRWLRFLSPISVIGGLISFVGLALMGVRYDPELRFYVIAARDGIVALYMFFGIIPINRYMWYRETVPTMRVRHVINMLLCVSYVLSMIGSAYAVYVVMFDVIDVNIVVQTFMPLTYLCFLFFVLALVPHRWIAVLLYPGRLYTYYRLQRLHGYVAKLAEEQIVGSKAKAAFPSPGDLELAIYQSVIFILDHAPLMDLQGAGQRLRQQVAQLAATELSYADLVKEIAALRYDRSHS